MLLLPPFAAVNLLSPFSFTFFVVVLFLKMMMLLILALELFLFFSLFFDSVEELGVRGRWRVELLPVPNGGGLGWGGGVGGADGGVTGELNGGRWRFAVVGSGGGAGVG